MVKSGSEHQTERRRDQEDRREGPARCAGPKREPPRQELADGQTGRRSDRNLGAQHVADRVVADAERPGHEHPDRCEADCPDGRMPEGVDRQAPIAVLDHEQPARDHDRQHSAGGAEQHEQRQHR